MEIPIVENPNLVNSFPEAQPASNNPPGWWSLRDVQGSREGVLRAIDAAPDIPDRWKTILKADIAAIDPAFNFFYIDAHCHAQGGNHTYHITIQPVKAAL